MVAVSDGAGAAQGGKGLRSTAKPQIGDVTFSCLRNRRVFTQNRSRARDSMTSPTSRRLEGTRAPPYAEGGGGTAA
jgi:hypothetical protein